MQAGIRFIHTNGAFGKKYLPETLGAGGLFLDADGDGWQDVLLVNSMNWPGQPGPRSLSGALPQQSTTAPSPTSRADPDSTSTCTAWAAPPRTSTTTGASTSTSPRSVATVCSGTSVQRQVRRRDKDSRRRRRRIFDERALVRLRQGRPARSVRRALRRVDHRARSVCTLDGKSKSYCTPESYKGAERRRSSATGATARSKT